MFNVYSNCKEWTRSSFFFSFQLLVHFRQPLHKISVLSLLSKNITKSKKLCDRTTRNCYVSSAK